jgi:2-keto-3-deoxy-galactonokinase
MREERASGLGRALFCVRLLQLEEKTTPQDRQAYLAGAFIAADMGLVAAAAASMWQTRILLAGNPALVRAWQDALEAVSIQGVVLDEPTVESAMLTGLCAIHARMRGHQGTSDSRLDEKHKENETAT